MRQGSSGRRPRGRPNRKQHGGAPRSSTFDSNGPEGRIRGNAHQVYEKYLGLARDAASSGDRIAAESFFQHAEHYFRILNDSTDPTAAEFNGEPRQRGEQQAHQGRGPNGPAAPRVNGSGPQPNVEFPIDLPPRDRAEAGGNGRDESAASGRDGQPGAGDGPAGERADGRSGGPRQRRRGRPPRPNAEADQGDDAAAARRAGHEGGDDEGSSEDEDGKTASA